MIQIMILGSFHFINNHQNVVDGDYNIQNEDVIELIEKLKDFQATKILVEYDQMKHDHINDQYKKYMESTFELSKNEIHQIAFPLAKQSNHKQIYPVDWNQAMPYSFSMGQVFDCLKDNNDQKLVNQFYQEADVIIRKIQSKYQNKSLLETFRYINSKEAIDDITWLNHRLITFNERDKYVGNKWLYGWYTRNLNIASNILGLAEESDRILLLYGNAHVKILKNMLEDHPNVEMVDVLTYL